LGPLTLPHVCTAGLDLVYMHIVTHVVYHSMAVEKRLKRHDSFKKVRGSNL